MYPDLVCEVVRCALWVVQIKSVASSAVEVASFSGQRVNVRLLRRQEKLQLPVSSTITERAGCSVGFAPLLTLSLAVALRQRGGPQCCERSECFGRQWRQPSPGLRGSLQVCCDRDGGLLA